MKGVVYFYVGKKKLGDELLKFISVFEILN